MGDLCVCDSTNLSPYCSNCSSDEEWTEVIHSHSCSEHNHHQQHPEEKTESPKPENCSPSNSGEENEPTTEQNECASKELKKNESAFCENGENSKKYHYDYDIFSCGDSYDDYNGPGLPPLIPLTRQQSSDTGYLFDGCDFDDETIIKSRRAVQKEDPNSCKGKTRRHKCFCTSCRPKYRSVLESSFSHISYDSKADDKSNAVAVGPHFLQVPCKKKNWDKLRETLSAAAVKTRVEPRRSGHQDIRKVEYFTLEPAYPKTISTTPVRMERQSMVYPKKSLPFTSGVYYAIKMQWMPGEKFDPNEDFSIYVRELPKPISIELEDDEYYCDFIPMFVSRNTKQANDSRLCYPLVSKRAVEGELARYGHAFRYYYSENQTATNYQSCWASQPVAVNDRARKAAEANAYQDWYLEMDLKGERKVRALVIQGRAPVVRCFPYSSHYDFRLAHYKGPFYPVIDLNNPQNQWVEKVEVLVRATRGEWHSLGVFKANVDCLNEVRIDLDLNFNVRYVRVRPLSRRHGGYHGDAPAMRCAVVAEKNRPGNKSGTILQHSNKTIVRDNNEATLVTYVLYTPDEKKVGVQQKASYISGRAIKSCATHASHYAKHIGKDDSVRFQKRKAFQAMIIDEDTFEDNATVACDDDIA